MVSFSFGPLWSFSPGRHAQAAFSSSDYNSFVRRKEENAIRVNDSKAWAAGMARQPAEKLPIYYSHNHDLNLNHSSSEITNTT
jgi:hypothetical protein